MMDTETRGPMSPTRLPRMILEDRYSGLLEVVVKRAGGVRNTALSGHRSSSATSTASFRVCWRGSSGTS